MKSKRPLFTICVPVYKSEQYVGLAIEDLILQTFSDYECIVIDDKSPDNALDVVKAKTKNDNRFKILENKKNIGVSATRNIGIDRASGEYILFLDSDDRYDVRLLERIVERIRSAGKKLDIVTWEFGGVGLREERVKMLEPWRENELTRNSVPMGVYSPIERPHDLFQINLNSMCMKCFRLDMLREKQLKINEDLKFGEDALFSYSALLSASAIAAIQGDNILYYYRRNQSDSAMHTIDISSQMDDHLQVIIKVGSFLKECGLYGLYQKSFERWISDGVGSIAVRMVTLRTQKNVLVNEQILAVTKSRSWRVMQAFKKVKNFFKIGM